MKIKINNPYLFSLILLIFTIFFINGCGENNNLFIIKDKSIIPQEKCNFLGDYVIIYETGCPFCEQVMPRIEKVEQDFNITFTRVNIALKQDYETLQLIKVLPEKVPCVIIKCKAYIGAGYSVEDFKQAILSS